MVDDPDQDQETGTGSGEEAEDSADDMEGGQQGYGQPGDIDAERRRRIIEMVRCIKSQKERQKSLTTSEAN